MPEATTTQLKRKRAVADDPNTRSAPAYSVEASAMDQLSAFNSDAQPNGNANAASDTAAAALAHYPIANDTSFQTQASTGDYTDAGYGLDQLKESPTQAQTTQQSSNIGTTPSKPVVGSDEWHKIRKDNHKEVERRRRETINEGINELAKIVPGCEKNKGSILQRAVQYIGQLKEAETTNLEKWTLEKLLLDQAINELSQTCDRLKADYQKAWEEKEAYRQACEEHNLTVEIKPREESTTTAPES
ncbi:uncharacterized protein PV09_08442 [Verruconis gallopava]|uniref:BHLH domain-containing protein n=1 Tax=Verruconis gallopava TaxID=253628 RepID=A0A0D1XCB5_9PEZI|nr:uncharacterized protein PV09_08442 [Verruconis gallopava]KIV99915.1 hypothetical protein PV09_08442 [Verruconis gallopava]